LSDLGPRGPTGRDKYRLSDLGPRGPTGRDKYRLSDLGPRGPTGRDILSFFSSPAGSHKKKGR